MEINFVYKFILSWFFNYNSSNQQECYNGLCYSVKDIQPFKMQGVAVVCTVMNFSSTCKEAYELIMKKVIANISAFSDIQRYNYSMGARINLINSRIEKIKRKRIERKQKKKHVICKRNFFSRPVFIYTG